MNLIEGCLDFASLSDRQQKLVVEKVAKDCTEYMERLDNPIELRWPIYRKYVRRVVDILVSSLALIVTSPINLVLLIATYIDVGSPVFFNQERVGKDGKKFQLVKFRNMTNETDENGVLLTPNKRVTKFGVFVRKTSLDELLNFWCIFKGDMTLIGPRPLPTKYYTRFSREHNQRHLVKPGLECPFHSCELAGMGWKGRLDNDIWYVKNISPQTDFLMLWRFVKKVFSKKERSGSASGQDSEFVGYDQDGNIFTSRNVPEKYLIDLAADDEDLGEIIDFSGRTNEEMEVVVCSGESVGGSF